MGERNIWLALALVIALSAVGLTVLITHINHTPAPVITLEFVQKPAIRFDEHPSFSDLERAGEQLPEVVLTNPTTVVLVPTPQTQSIFVKGFEAGDLSCEAMDVSNGGVVALIAAGGEGPAIASVPVERRGRDFQLQISDQQRRDFARMPARRGAIKCRSTGVLGAKPTFTDRATEVQADVTTSGGLLVNVAALDVENLRFSGGVQAPFGGDRVRLLLASDNVISAQWTNEIASEKRDIILVLIGGLSAIAAAMVIEAIRPTVQAKSKRA